MIGHRTNTLTGDGNAYTASSRYEAFLYLHSFRFALSFIVSSSQCRFWLPTQQYSKSHSVKQETHPRRPQDKTCQLAGPSYQEDIRNLGKLVVGATPIICPKANRLDIRIPPYVSLPIEVSSLVYTSISTTSTISTLSCIAKSQPQCEFVAVKRIVMLSA